MQKGKLIPLIIIIILLVISAALFTNGMIKNKQFDKLVVTYNNQKNEYDNLTIDDVIVVGNVSFWVISIQKNLVVLNSSEDILINNQKSFEITIKLNEEKNVCITENNCIVMHLQ